MRSCNTNRAQVFGTRSLSSPPSSYLSDGNKALIQSFHPLSLSARNAHTITTGAFVGERRVEAAARRVRVCVCGRTRRPELKRINDNQRLQRTRRLIRRLEFPFSSPPQLKRDLATMTSDLQKTNGFSYRQQPGELLPER